MSASKVPSLKRLVLYSAATIPTEVVVPHLNNNTKRNKIRRVLIGDITYSRRSYRKSANSRTSFIRPQPYNQPYRVRVIRGIELTQKISYTTDQVAMPAIITIMYVQVFV